MRFRLRHLLLARILWIDCTSYSGGVSAIVFKLDFERLAINCLNIWREEGTQDPDLRMAGGRYDHWHQFVRVWYEAD